MTAPMTPEELATAGRMLFGEQWQTDLTHALGLSDSARIRRMLAGTRPIPVGFRAEIVALLAARGEAAIALSRQLASG